MATPLLRSTGQHGRTLLRSHAVRGKLVGTAGGVFATGVCALRDANSFQIFISIGEKCLKVNFLFLKHLTRWEGGGGGVEGGGSVGGEGGREDEEGGYNILTVWTITSKLHSKYDGMSAVLHPMYSDHMTSCDLSVCLHLNVLLQAKFCEKVDHTLVRHRLRHGLEGGGRAAQ